jgi:hypothetical protein
MNHCTQTNEVRCSETSQTYRQVGTNAEPLGVEFCNFMQCHIFVYYSTFCY